MEQPSASVLFRPDNLEIQGIFRSFDRRNSQQQKEIILHIKGLGK